MKKVYCLTFILGFIGIVALVLICIFNCNLQFDLMGSDYQTIEVGDNYEDLGYSLKIFEHDINKKVVVDSNVNMNKVGKYYLNYKVKLLGRNYTLYRKVDVLDTDKPSIKLNGDSEIVLYRGDEYKEEGAIAFDNYDGDITSSIVINGYVNTDVIGKYELEYSVADSSGNKSIVSRIVTIKENAYSYQNGIDNNSDFIVKYIYDNNYKVSVGYYNLVTKKSYYYRENKVYYGASLIKTLDAIYLYENDLVNEELKPYIKKAISVSDNNSHYYLVNYIGRENLKSYGISLGAKNTLSGNDSYGNTTVLDQIIYWKKLYDISRNNEELEGYFVNNYGNYIKVDNLRNMHKYGYYSSNFHDVGVIFDEEPYILVVLTEHGNSNAKEVIGNISNLMYKYHKS